MQSRREFLKTVCGAAALALGPVLLADDAMAAAGIRRKSAPPLKILGTGELTRAITVKAHRFSKDAKAKIEKAGGKAILIETKKSATAAE